MQKPNLRKVVSHLKLLNEIRLTGGVLYNINTGESNPREGYLVILPNHQAVVSSIDEETISAYINKNINQLVKDNAFFSCWFDGHNFILDVSEIYERKRDAVFHAIVKKHHIIWDCATQDEIAVNLRGSLVKQYINS